MILIGRQIRDARFRARLELQDLGARAGGNSLQPAYAEAKYGAPPWSADDFDRFQRALEAAGVEFDRDDGGPSILLRKMGLGV